MIDYSKFEIGMKIDYGEIQTCQKCGRVGLLTETDGKKWVTHRHGHEMKGSILRTAHEDCLQPDPS